MNVLDRSVIVVLVAARAYPEVCLLLLLYDVQLARELTAEGLGLWWFCHVI